MCRLLHRTYFCETVEGGNPHCNHQALWPDERCRVAQRQGLEHCNNLRKPSSDYCNHCYAPICCFNRVRDALYAWGFERTNARGGYSEDTAEAGEKVKRRVVEHGRSCGFREQDFYDLRMQVLQTLNLSDDRPARPRVRSGGPEFKW